MLGILLGLDLPATAETRDLDERFLADAVADVTVRFLAGVAALEGAAGAIVVEDAHFMDQASAELLQRLAGTIDAHPLALSSIRSGHHVTRTDEDRLGICRSHCFRSHNGTQSRSSRSQRTGAVWPHEVETIAHWSGGSPFLFELRTLPVQPAHRIAARIGRGARRGRHRQAPAGRPTVLRYASVLGATFERELLAVALRDEVTLDDAFWERCRGVVDADAAGRMHFRSALLRDAAYEGLPFRRRRELHARVAEAIELTAASPEAEAAMLALHYSAANQREKTWHFARLAADRALAVAANVEAARLYELAVSAGASCGG